MAHEKGDLEDFLDTDIPEIKLEGQEWRNSNINLGIKTTKMRGIWLDIPGDQFNHSDYHILVKVGVGRDHLFGFFKKISVFKDKILRLGIEIGALDEDESLSLFDSSSSEEEPLLSRLKQPGGRVSSIESALSEATYGAEAFQ